MVYRDEKPIPVFNHFPAVDLVDDRVPVAPAYIFCCSCIGRQVYIQPAFGDQPLSVDGLDIFLSCSVPEDVRRDFFFQLYIYRDGMPLVRTDQSMVFVKSTTRG